MTVEVKKVFTKATVELTKKGALVLKKLIINELHYM